VQEEKKKGERGKNKTQIGRSIARPCLSQACRMGEPGVKKLGRGARDKRGGGESKKQTTWHGRY